MKKAFLMLFVAPLLLVSCGEKNSSDTPVDPYTFMENVKDERMLETPKIAKESWTYDCVSKNLQAFDEDEINSHEIGKVTFTFEETGISTDPVQLPEHAYYIQQLTLNDAAYLFETTLEGELYGELYINPLRVLTKEFISFDYDANGGWSAIRTIKVTFDKNQWPTKVDVETVTYRYLIEGKEEATIIEHQTANIKYTY